MYTRISDFRLVYSESGAICKVFLFFFLLPAGSAACRSADIVFTHGPFLGFFAPQGRHVAPIKVKFGMEALHAKFHLDRFRGRGLRFFITVSLCDVRLSHLYTLLTYGQGWQVFAS